MRILILATAVSLSSLFLTPDAAQAQGWGRMYGTGYTVPDNYSYFPNYIPRGGVDSGYSYYPGYQSYPGYYSPNESRSYYDNGYYNNYNLGYSSGLCTRSPYRSYYSPGTTYRGYSRGY